MCHETPDTITPRIIALLQDETVAWTGNEILARIASGDFPCEAHFDETIRRLVREGALTSESDPFDPKLTSTTRCRLAYILAPGARPSAVRLPGPDPTPPPRRIEPRVEVAPPPTPPPPPVAPALPSPAARLEAIGRLRDEKARLEKLWCERFGEDCFRKGSSEFLKTVFLRARVHGLVPRLRDALEKSRGRPLDDFEKSCETLVQINDRDGTIPVGVIESGVTLDLLAYAAMDLDRAERELREGGAGNPANAREILLFLKTSLDDGSLDRFRPGANPDPRPAPPPAPAADPLIGTSFGAYRVVGILGRGGMGVVYEGWDETLGRHVALKVLHPQYANNREYQERFLREARNAASATLDHPNITQVYAAGRQGPHLWMAMQLVRGRTLTKLLEERTTLPAPEALRIARQVAEGLSAAHAARLIHRDIKPDNLMVEESGRVKIMDFGLMRSIDVSKDTLTVEGLFIGTLEYASPEQCRDKPLDARTDLYSLGVVLYELLSGKRPYRARTPLAYLTVIPDPQQPPTPLRQQNPAVPPAVELLVHRLISKRAEERPATAEALIAEIDQVLAAPGSGPRPGPAPSLVRNAVLSMAAWGLVLAAAIGAAVWFWPKDAASPPGDPRPPVAPARADDSKEAPETDLERQAKALSSRIGEPGTLERLLTAYAGTRAAERAASDLLSAFERALKDEPKNDLVGPAAWRDWNVDARDAPGGAVVADPARSLYRMSSPSAKEQVRLLRTHLGAEKGYRIRWAFGAGASGASAFTVALSLAHRIEISPAGATLFRVQRHGGAEDAAAAGKVAFPRPLAGGILHVVPRGDLVLVFLDGKVLFVVPAKDPPLAGALQLGMSGGSVLLESIRVAE